MLCWELLLGMPGQAATPHPSALALSPRPSAGIPTQLLWGTPVPPVPGLWVLAVGACALSLGWPRATQPLPAPQASLGDPALPRDSAGLEMRCARVTGTSW